MVDTPPTITDIKVTFDSPATITWTTDENSTSLVKYGTQNGSYTSSISDPSYNTSHSITLFNLTPGTRYYYVVNSTDISGNSNQSTEDLFTTPPSGVAALEISNVMTSGKTTVNIKTRELWTLDIVVSNNGQTSLSNAVVMDTIPVEITLEDFTASKGYVTTTVKNGATKLTWTIGRMLPGDAESLMLNVSTKTDVTTQYFTGPGEYVLNQGASVSANGGLITAGPTNPITIYAQTATDSRIDGGRSGGGGGGGGTATSFEAWIKDVSTGQTFELEIDDEDIPYINGFSLTAKQAIYSSKLAITDLDKKPWYSMADPDASVLRYFKVGYDKNNYVENARFKVSVNKSWLKDNDIDPYKFVLYHYTTSWEKLDTKILKEDNESIYFEAATPGFSYFSLGGESGSGYRAIKKEVVSAPVGKETVEKTDAPSVIPAAHKTKAKEITKTDTGSGESDVPTTTILSRIFQLVREGLPIAVVLAVIGGIFSYSVKTKARKGMVRKSEAPEEKRTKPLLDLRKMQKEKVPDGKI